MFSIFKKQKEEIIYNEELLKKQEACLHKNFEIYNHNLLNQATCNDCGKTDYSYLFFNLLIQRLRGLEKKLEDKLNA